MLVFKPTPGQTSTYSVQHASYLALRDDVAFGRIDCCDRADGTGDGLISIRDARFECRIHIAGKARWTYVPAEWVMYSGERKLHIARPDGGRTFLVEGGDLWGPLRLRIEG